MPLCSMHQFILLFTVVACSYQAKGLPHQWTKLANGISLAPLLVVGLGLLSNLLHGGKVYKGRHLCKDSVIFQLVILINDHCDNFYVVQHSNVFQLMQQWQDSNAWPLDIEASSMTFAPRAEYFTWVVSGWIPVPKWTDLFCLGPSHES